MPRFVPIVVTASGNAQDFVRGLRDAFDDLDESSERASSGGMKDAFLQADLTSRAFSFLSREVVQLAKDFVAFTQESTHAAAELQQSVANSLSIKPELDASQVYRELSDMQRRVPQTSKQLAESLYDVFSSINATQEEGLQLVEKFGRGATAAVTDAKTYGTAIVGVINAYKKEIDDADHISDVFFNTVSAGVVTGQELASNLGIVTQAGKNAGVSFEELGALIAGVTKEGGNASQNINNLANTLQKLPTKETQKELNALGITTRDASGKFLPFIDILTQLDAKLERLSQSKRAQVLQNIFPDVQARTGLQTLLSQLEFVREQTDLNKESAGSAAAAYETMANTYAAASQLQENAVNSLKEAVGELITTNPKLAEANRIVTEQINEYTDAVRDADSDTQQFGVNAVSAYAKMRAVAIPALGSVMNATLAFAIAIGTIPQLVLGATVRAIEIVINSVLNIGALLWNAVAVPLNKAMELIGSSKRLIEADYANIKIGIGGMALMEGALQLPKQMNEYWKAAKENFKEASQALDRLDNITKTRSIADQRRLDDQIIAAADIRRGDDQYVAGVSSKQNADAASNTGARDNSSTDASSTRHSRTAKEDFKYFDQVTRHGGYGAPRDGGTRPHTGLDFAGNLGDPVGAAASGTVTYAGTGKEMGNFVVVDHHNGVITRYGHLDKIAKGLRVGSEVEKGTYLGNVGQTGNAKGVHLHFDFGPGGSDPTRSKLRPVRISDSDARTAERPYIQQEDEFKKQVDALIAHREHLLRIADSYDSRSIEAIRSLAELRVFTNEDAEKRVAVIELAGLDRRLQILKEDRDAAIDNNIEFTRLNDQYVELLDTKAAKEEETSLRIANARQKDFDDFRQHLNKVRDLDLDNQRAAIEINRGRVDRLERLGAGSDFIKNARQSLDIASENLDYLRQSQELRAASERDSLNTTNEQKAQIEAFYRERQELLETQHQDRLQEIRERPLEEYQRLLGKISDQTVYHADQVNQKILEFLASQKSVSESVADFKIGIISQSFNEIDNVLDKVIPKMHGWGDILKQIIGDLLKLEASKFFLKLLGLDVGGEPHFGQGDAKGGGGGGFNLGSIFNLGGGNQSGGGLFSNLLGGGGNQGVGGGIFGGLRKLLGFGSSAAATGGAAAGGIPAALTAGQLSAGMASAAAYGPLVAGGGAAAAGGGAAAAGAGSAGAGGAGGLGSLGFLANPYVIAGIAAAIGGYFLFKHFFGHKTEKALRKTIEQEYGIQVKDMKLLEQVKGLGEGVFGKGNVRKHLVETVKLEPVKELLQNYAEATNQKSSKLATNAQLQDPGNEQNQFVRRLMGGLVPYQRRGFDYVPLLADGGEYVATSETTAREGVAAFDALNAGRATIVPKAKKPVRRLDGGFVPSSGGSSSSSQGSSQGSSGMSPVLVAAYVGAMNRMAAAIERMESASPGEWLRVAAAENPDAVVDGLDEGLNRSHPKKGNLQRHIAG
jgi:TP901 family phage tail tape measure protein